jgi:hypothetical protein
LVNLISRPVILDIPREQANLAQVLSLLHQPVIDKGEITVIKPGSGVQNVSLDQAFETTLATGTVLVFDPATVNSAVLPRLPPTIGANANSETAVAKTSAESVSLQKKVLETGSTAQAEPTAHRSLLVPQVTSLDASDARSPSLPRESVEDSPAASKQESYEPAKAAEVAGDEPFDSPDFQALPDTTDEQSAEAEPAAALARPTFSMASLVMLTGIIVCCFGLLWWSRFKRQAKPVATRSLPEPVQQHENSLELLISGKLPIVTEPLQLPYESAIFGRPLDTSPYRTDPAQTLSGPHFIPQHVPQPGTSTSPATSPAVVVVEQAHDPASTPATRKVRVDMRHPRSTASVLDRALATFEGEQP